MSLEHSNLYKDSPESKRQSPYSLVIDITNWYMRIFYYQKITGLNRNTKINLKRVIELHKKLSKINPNFKKFLDAIYKK